MTADGLVHNWSQRFGLARAPLFEAGETQLPGEHVVLLDGGYGSFALSDCDEELWRTVDPAAWIWSSDVAHHVAVTRSKVGVIRWDRPQDPKVYERRIVEDGLERFYTYLLDDRLRSNKSVVEHLLGLFRRLRSLGHGAGLPDAHATDIFTATLATMVAGDEARETPELFGVTPGAFILCDRLDGQRLSAVVEDLARASGSLSQLRLLPALTIRHAAGLLFQEAHFELLRAPESLDLFGLIGAPEVKERSRGGTHFTPPALARTVVEQALAVLPNLSTRTELTLCDPTCGSGAFLHEALRALRRSGFNGRLNLIGHDLSPAAIAMARFVLHASLRDWSPKGGMDLILSPGDSLGDLGIPAADVIVMNPPFIAFGAQTPLQREQLRAATGPAGAARGDYSMAFILRALEALRSEGVLGALFPASLLSLQAASGWRGRLADAGEIRLLASIGDFGLFTHALVQVACTVIRKSQTASAHEVTALVTGNEPRATGEAFRWLRKLGSVPPATAIAEESWTLFPVSSATLKARSTWRLPSPGAERVLRALSETELPTVADLFEVGQGVQTGLNEALLLTAEEWSALPPKERRYFRAVTMTDSIQSGRMVKPYRLFFPHSSEGPIFDQEADLKSAVPTFYRRYLEPNRQRLSRRATIVRSRRSDWWGLMHWRDWSFGKQPRIISKFFGGEGAFFGDYDASYIPVMGHIWLPKSDLIPTEKDELPITQLLAAYVALFNSQTFVKLLSFYSPHVAGGQFDLSARHVAHIPTPDLRAFEGDVERGRAVVELAEQGRHLDLGDPTWRARTSQLVIDLYGARTLADL